MATDNTYTSLLSTAGLSPNQYGLEVALDAANKAVMMPLVTMYPIPKGASLYIPKVGARSAAEITRGADETDAITYKNITDTAASFTKKFSYDALEMGYATLNDLPPAHLAATLNAVKAQMGSALANDVDSSLLGLYASASSNVGSSGDNVTYDLLIEAIRKLRVANAPGDYFIVLPETQWDHLAKIDELIRYEVRGEGSAITNGTMFKLFGVSIFCTNNVPTAAGAAHGLAFSRGGIALAVRDMVTVKEWDEPNNFAYRLAVFSDYAYANTYTDYIVDFITTDD